MSLSLRPFQPYHLALIPSLAPLWSAPLACAVGRYTAFSGFDEDGIVGAAGVAAYDELGLVAWAAFTDRLPRHLKAVLQACRLVLDAEPEPVTALVDPAAANADKAKRFAEVLGFNPDGTEQGYLRYRRMRP